MSETVRISDAADRDLEKMQEELNANGPGTVAKKEILDALIAGAPSGGEALRDWADEVGL